MSSVSPRAARVLRMAVVFDDAVCAELHQSEPESVTVGRSYRNDVLVPGRNAPEAWTLFKYDRREGAYYLDLPLNARGKIRVGNKTMSVGKLAKRFAQGNHVRIRLEPRSRGKLRIGEALVMFQFAKPKPIPPKLPFPAIFRASAFAMVGALFLYSQLASVSILGPFFAWAYFSELPAEVEPDERWLAIIEAPKMKKKEEPEEEDEEEEEKDELAEEEEEEEEPEKKPETKKLAEKPTQFSKQAMQEARSVGVARVLGTYGGPGEGTVFDVIQSTENNLGEMFAQGMTTTVLADGGPIGEFVPGGEGISLRGSAVGTKGFETEGPALSNKVEKRERKVKGRTKTSKTDITGGGDSKALRATIKHRTSALQHCYNKALRTQPELAGKMTYTIFISVMGTVTKVVIEEDSLGSASVATCTKTKIRGWRFPMNGADEGAEVTFSVVFSGS